jgi:MSHA biogenesis protein MshL
VTIGSDTVSLPLALSTIRESDSIVRARNNQVIVIGGLMQTASSNSNAGAPGLRDIPGVGLGFSQRREQSIRSELVILVRPVVSDLDANRRDLDSSLERIMGLKI